MPERPLPPQDELSLYLNEQLVSFPEWELNNLLLSETPTMANIDIVDAIGLFPYIEIVNGIPLIHYSPCINTGYPVIRSQDLSSFFSQLEAAEVPSRVAPIPSSYGEMLADMRGKNESALMDAFMPSIIAARCKPDDQDELQVLLYFVKGMTPQYALDTVKSEVIKQRRAWRI